MAKHAQRRADLARLAEENADLNEAVTDLHAQLGEQQAHIEQLEAAAAKKTRAPRSDQG